MNKIVWSVLLSIVSLSVQADVNTYFDSIKQDPNALYAFLKEMPKGGELHYHLAGGAYPEAMLNLAAKKSYCLDNTTYSITANKKCAPEMSSHRFASDDELYQQYVRAWSLKDFIPDQQTAEDHFFSAFYKFIPIVSENEAQMLVDVLQRADAQHEQYMEIFTIPDDAKSAAFGELLKNKKNDVDRLTVLQKNKAFNDNIKLTMTKGHDILNETREQLDCNKNPQALGCNVTVRFQYYVLRQLPNDAFFAMATNAFAVASQSPDYVAINVVQQEDSLAALIHYKKQMQILNFLHQQYPKAHISLHAGELSPQAVSPIDLRFHIHDAITVGHAERIGHGVDIAYEDNADDVVRMMAAKHIAVEVNLTSNAWLVNVKGNEHPLHYYLTNHVPVVLSTDDEGLLRTDLTREYVRAVTEQRLNYQDLKTMTRNVLTYSFLPGKSLWQDAETATPVSECRVMISSECQNFLAQNEKARMQKQLEDKLAQFEAKY